MAQDLGIGPQREIIQLPDGTQYDITDATEEERRAIAELYRQQQVASPSLSQLVEDFPKGLRYGEVEADPERTNWGRISQFALGIPRGMTQTGLSLLGGIAGLTSLDEDTDLEKRIRVAQRKTREGFGADPDYEDTFARKGGEAIGSGLAYMGGAGLMRKGLASLPLSASIKAAPTIATLRLQRLLAGSSPGAVRGGASRFFAGTAQQAALTAPLSVPIQMGQHAAQVHNYELLTGEDIPRDVEKAGYLKSIGPGLTEAIGIGAFGGRTGSAFGREAIRKSMQQGWKGEAGERLGWAIAGGAEEAAQETVQAFMSAKIASSYDDEAMGRMVKEMKEGAKYGGFAGFVLSGMLHKTSRSIGRDLLGIDISSAEALQSHINQQRLLRPLGSNPTQEQIRKRQVQQQRDRNYERTFARSQNQFGTADPTLTEEEQTQLRQNLLDIYIQEVTTQEENKVAEDNTYQPLNEADIEVEAQGRTEQRYQDDLRFYQESLQNEEDVRTEVGLTFAELDKIGAKPIQELLTMVADGDLTQAELELVIVADRLSRAGGVDRDEVRDFAIRTTDVNNRFDSGAVASFILMSDPAFIAERTRQVADVEVQQELNRRIEEAQREGKKPPTKLTKKVEQGIRDEIVNNATSVDLFGEGTASQKFTTAKQILINAFPTSYLNSENVLTKPYLTPAEVNSLIAEIGSKTEKLNANKIYDLLYEDRGTLALSDAVERASSAVDPEQVTLSFTDPAAQEVVVLAQEGVKALEGTQKQFETAIMDLLKAKNISVKYGTTKFGTSGLEGTAFTALVQKVLGHNNIKQVRNPAQRRMLYGHLMNMPTFAESTILPDLSDPLYTPAQLTALLDQLSFIEGPMIRIDRLFESMNKRDIPESRIKNSEYQSYLQAIRHLLDSGYISSRGAGQNIRIGFAEDNRSHARTPAIAEEETQRTQFEQDQQARRAEEDQDRREYEERQIERLNKESKLQENLETFERLWTEQLKGWGVPQEYVEGVFARDVTDPILSALVGSETNVIDNPEQLQDRLAEFNTDTGQLLINLSFADPNGTRDPMEIIQDLKPEVFESLLKLGALTQPDVEILDKQLKVQIVPEELWKEFASPELEYQEMTFLQFSDMIEPGAGQAEVMESARGLLMRSLIKNQLAPSKTAGRVGTIKGLIQSAFGQQIEASRTSGIAPLINILNRFDQGLMAQPPGVAPLLTPRTLDGRIRNTTGLDYISPELRKSLRQAMLLNDTQAQDEAIEKILRTERTDETLADAPTESWETSTFGRILYEEELNSTVPGTIPNLGPNASDNAIEAYFAQKLGRTPYIMPPIAKSRFRNKVSWTPNAELTELIEKHGGENITKGGKLIYEQMADNIQGLMKEYDVDKLDELTEADEAKLFEGTKEIIEESQRAWMKEMSWADNLLGRQVFTRAYRSVSHGVLNNANPAEIRDQESAYRNSELRKIAEVAMASALIFRNQSMNLATNAQRVGAIVYIGTAENGAPMIVERTGPDQASLNEMFVLLPTAQDISYATVYGAALRFLARNQNMTLAKQELTKARDRGDMEEIAFFASNAMPLAWTTVAKEDAGGNIFVPNADGKMSEEEQTEAAQRIVDLISEQNPDIKRFFELYAEYNENVQIPFQVQTGILTPEMAEFVKKQAYVPLLKNIGEEASYPLGSTGRPIPGRTTIQVDNLYDTPLTSFSKIDKVDIVKAIQTYNYRMINEALTNVAAIRAVKDFEEATAAGLGIQSINVTAETLKRHAAGDFTRRADEIRLRRNGRVEYHRVADPQVAAAVMTQDMKPGHKIVQWFQRAGEFTRNTVVKMPDFIWRNFTKDQQQFTDIYGGSTGEYLPQVGILKGLLKATSPDALLRMRKAGFATDSPMSYNIQLRERGAGQTTYSGRSMTGEQLAQDAIKVEKFNQWAERYMKEGKIRPDNMSDMMALLSVGYRNLMTMSEGTARLSAHDITLARTGSPAQAMLDGYELMNYGKRGSDSSITTFMSMVPFLRGGAIGLDTTLRAFAATPDAPGAHLADSRVHYRNQFYTRLMMGALSHIMYRALWDGLGDEDDEGRSAYDRASTYDKMNYILVPTPGPIPMKLPTKFMTGLFTNTIPGAIYDHNKYKDFTTKDALGEIGERAAKEFKLPFTGPILKTLINQKSNRNSFTGEPITPSYLENFPSEDQYTDRTSVTARSLAEGIKWLTFFDPNGPEVEQFLEDTGTTTATLMLALADRMTMAMKGESPVGTPNDWDHRSPFGGPGIENLPLSQLGNPPEIDAAINEKYYELSDFFEAYNALVTRLESEDDPDDTIEDRYKNADDVAKYEQDFGRFRRYMNAYRIRIERILEDTATSDPEKRARLQFEQRQKSKYLQDLTDIMLGIQATDNPGVKGAV